MLHSALCNATGHVTQPIQGTAALCLSYKVVGGYTNLSHLNPCMVLLSHRRSGGLCASC